jgi:tetratricopeptide (TPR) repeat protein
MIINHLNNRAINLIKQDDYDTCYRLIKRDATNAAAYAKLGNLLEKDKKYHEAIDAYEKSLIADDRQKDISRSYQALIERFALEESKQIRCPKCLTIVPLEYGKCWKCERIFDNRQYMLTNIKKKGKLGIILLIFSGITLLISIFAFIASMIKIYSTYVTSIVFIIIFIISCIVTFVLYRKTK